MASECRLSDYGEDGTLCETHGLVSSVDMCATGVRLLWEEAQGAWRGCDKDRVAWRQRAEALVTGLRNICHMITGKQYDGPAPLGVATSAVSELLRSRDAAEGRSYERACDIEDLVRERNGWRRQASTLAWQLEDLQHEVGELKEKLRQIMHYTESLRSSINW